MKRQFVLAAGFRRVALLLGLATSAWSTFTSTSQAQTALTSVQFAQPKGGETLEADFFLPQPDKVSSFDVSIDGKPLDKDKVKFTPTDKVPNYHCAILLVVDKTLAGGGAGGGGKEPEIGGFKPTDKPIKVMDRGADPDKSADGQKSADAQKGAVKDAGNGREKLLKAVRHTLSQIAAGTGVAPYQFAVGTISAGNFEVLAPMGSEKSIINSAIDKLPFNGTSPELYLGTKRAIDWLSGTPAERKFLVIISDGTSQDKVTSPQDVIQAATKANIHICTIGFPKSPGVTDGVQRLGPLAEGTGGYALRADGAEPKLPTDAEGNLLKFAASGGKAEISLKGLKAPVNLTCSVQTEFAKAYTFTHTVDTIEAAPVAESTPAPAPSKWDAIKGRLTSHPILTACGGLAMLVALLFLVVLIARLAKKPAESIQEPSQVLSSNVTTQVMPTSDETEKLVEPPAPAPVSALAWLVTLDAEQTRHPISKNAIRIGRKPDNDIVMKNDSVSSYHAEILKRGEKFVITDLDSSNKIVVAGRLVDKAPLEDGDVIELGEVRLRFVMNQLNDSL